ncbi:MAG: MBL fold metallo-hydrolase, partial [Planctomycetota bacterium]
ALLSGFGVLVFGWLCPPIAEVCSWMSTSALKCMEACVQFTEPQPGSHFWVAGPSTEWVLVFYALLFVGVIAFYSPSKRLACTAMAYGMLGFGLILPANGEDARAIAPPFQATFLSVGHGGCVVLEFPDGQTWLYDAGSLGSINASTDIVSRFLWDRGIRRLDTIILSHADIDHYNVVPGLLQRFEVDRAIVSHAMFVNEDRALKVLRDSLKASRVRIEMMQAGGSVGPVGGVALQVLHPSTAIEPDNDNSNSLVLQMDYLGKSILLTGDLEAGGLEQVLAGQSVNCDVALAPHHGSHRSRPQEFVDWCHPEFVIVSNGMVSSKGTGPSAYDECGCTVLETSKAGAVAATIDEQGVSVKPFHVP